MVFNGTVQELQVLLAEIRAVEMPHGVWVASNGEELHLNVFVPWRSRLPKEQAAWWVHVGVENRRCAAILAYQHPGGTTNVHFRDGYMTRSPQPVPAPPIGPAFAEFRDWLAGELGLVTEGDSKNDQDTGKRGPSPTTMQRASRFKRLKDKNPDWTKVEVGKAAWWEQRDELKAKHPKWEDFELDKQTDQKMGDFATMEDNVNNAYRAMGWQWPAR
ncbi:MAG: hypothetical protein GX605_06250 [Chloroflexi bacterium]|nr:hypothetical protein [Chloroflexota bacterium]